ncbi:IS4 family transposase [Candidatus Micrarchaeota archaeon]|nr:IS4 family transposase [Candidatus Micrarchaeota archaeon]
MPINTLYHTWFQRIRDLRPFQRITQLRNFVWLLVGIHQSRSVCLSRIAGKIPGTAKLTSLTRRLSRFLDNAALNVRDWYAPIARQWIESQAACGQQVHLIVDGTKVGFTYQLLMVSLAYRHRAIPIAWTWVRHIKGHSTSHLQLSLLSYVHSLLPRGIAVLLVGDCEFGSIEVLKQLDKWRWDYVLRQKSSTHTCLAHETEWQDFGKRIDKPGQSRWLGKGYLTESQIYPVNLLIHWQIGGVEPWCLAANLPDRRMALQAYRRRMWTEEMFGDMKRHGFDLESTMLRHARRLSRLTLAVVFLYVWCMAVGTRTIRSGLRHLVDRIDRRDLSVFQIGLRYIERQLINAHSFLIPLFYEL